MSCERCQKRGTNKDSALTTIACFSLDRAADSNTPTLLAYFQGKRWLFSLCYYCHVMLAQAWSYVSCCRSVYSHSHISQKVLELSHLIDILLSAKTFATRTVESRCDDHSHRPFFLLESSSAYAASPPPFPVSQPTHTRFCVCGSCTSMRVTCGGGERTRLRRLHWTAFDEEEDEIEFNLA